MTWVERFWKYVDKSGDCWTWTGAKIRGGYGHLSVNGRRRGTHRLSWELTNGPIDVGLFVCHRCDNPSCVRPEHLFLGTPKQNTQDAVTKHRMTRGSEISHSRLKADQVIEIRRLVASGLTQTAVAAQFSVSISTVNYIHNRATWKHIV